MDTAFCCAEDVGNEGELKYLKERDLEVFFSCDLPPLPEGLRLTVLKQAIWSKLEAMYHTEQVAAAGSGAGGPAAVSAVGLLIKEAATLVSRYQLIVVIANSQQEGGERLWQSTARSRA